MHYKKNLYFRVDTVRQNILYWQSAVSIYLKKKYLADCGNSSCRSSPEEIFIGELR